MKISPLAPESLPALPPLDGVRLIAVEAGIKYAGRKDLMLMVFDRPASAAGVFTRSKCASAPVDWCRDLLAGTASPQARAVVVNAGNANAFTGMKGAQATAQTAAAAAAAVGCEANQVYLASTGVIGEPLDAAGFSHYLDAMAKDALASNWEDAARAIMTTDTFAKTATRQVEIGGKTVTINGIAKGSGMIAPDMATMLAFVVTDADIAAADLQTFLSQTADASFNSITVDSDTSTSDTVLLFATGGSTSASVGSADSAEGQVFAAALMEVMHELSQLIVRDGEGATKLLEVRVTGATNDQAAKKIAMSIANSPLVKTAVAGEDANWGRVVMAVGKAGEEADRDRLAIWFGDIRVAHQGERDPDYDEDAASAAMKKDEILVRADLGLGDGQARVWTCDLTKEYVAINGDYRS